MVSTSPPSSIKGDKVHSPPLPPQGGQRTSDIQTTALEISVLGYPRGQDFLERDNPAP